MFHSSSVPSSPRDILIMANSLEPYSPPYPTKDTIMSTKLTATKKVTKYTVGLDQFTLDLLRGVNERFNEHSKVKFSKSLLVRKALQDYTGKLLSANDPSIFKGELELIKSMRQI
jgi:hypothetical protein